jgi:DNA-binding NarL/FixJ family response regulator
MNPSLSVQGAVLVADDHVLVRQGIRLLVAGVLGQPDFLEAGDGESLLRTADSSRVGLALVDWKMPGMREGLCLGEMARRHPEIPIVVISAFTSPDVVRLALDIATVYAFVAKSGSVADIGAAIDAATRRHKLLPVLARAGSAGAATLTPRQSQIRALLRQGMSNKVIAQNLGISEGTVKNHISEIFRILKAANRTQAAQHSELE